MAARSRRVRAGVVTRMPWCSVISSSAEVRRAVDASSRVAGRAPPSLRTLTSIRAAALGRISQSDAAEAWLNAAPGPAASTAAIRARRR